MAATEAARGLHHVTAIASDPAANVAFYTGLLGLRLVKRTVNFDDPGNWHLYDGDGLGRPGTLLTFFPFPGLPRGRHGTGQAVEIGFAIPRAALGPWIGRLTERGIPFEGPLERFGERVLRFRDPDGLQLELVTEEAAGEREPWAGGDLPPEQALRGLYGVTLWAEGYEHTARLLLRHLGFAAAGEEAGRFRFLASGAGPGRVVDIRCVPGFWSGAPGAGTVHHLAFRAADAADQEGLRAGLVAEGLDVTPPLDRRYFRSVYFREPGRVLFEIATDPPGFTVDEPAEALGSTLRLPPWLEPRRAAIERLLPPLERAAEDELFAYRFVPAGEAAPTFALLLLHGTGGDEHDLLPLGAAVAPGAALLSPRGRVLEEGRPRFFRRLAEGVFDAEDLRRRAGELAAFLARAAARHGLAPGRLVALGVSNGANMAGATLLRHPESLAGAVLLRPMALPFDAAEVGRLDGRRVLILAGREDPIVRGDQPAALAAMLAAAGAEVTLDWVAAGHQITEEEVPMIATWLARQGFAPEAAA